MTRFKPSFLAGFPNQYAKSKHTLINISYRESSCIIFKRNIDFKYGGPMEQREP